MATPAPVSGNTPAIKTATTATAKATFATTIPTPIFRMAGAAASTYSAAP